MNTTMTIDAAEYMEPENMTEQIENEIEDFESLMEQLADKPDKFDDLEDDELGFLLIYDRFSRIFFQMVDTEEVQQEVNAYQIFCEKHFKCKKANPLSFLFTGFAFGMGEGIKLATEITNM